MPPTRLQTIGKFFLAFAGAWVLVCLIMVLSFFQNYTADLFGKGLPKWFLIRVFAAGSVGFMVKAFPIALAYAGIRIGGDIKKRIAQSIGGKGDKTGEEGNTTTKAGIRKKLWAEAGLILLIVLPFVFTSFQLSNKKVADANLLFFRDITTQPQYCRM